ncbi:MAG: aldehyde dehydrogenase family protein [Myxococcales bacterium]|nr:aldehyde dehydrogenase family protein [Myxococcales bacterium]MDH3842486.1 aldehyde dehydrogenase family protein [Myxococcales bacterium]
MKKLEVTAPYDQSVIKEYEYHTEQQALGVLANAYDTYTDRAGWLTGARRIEILNALSDLIESKAEELALQAAREGGKPLRDSLVEIRRAITGIRVASAAVSRLVGHEVPMGIDERSLGRWAVTYREPRGVVLAISAFNHPFNLLVHQVVTAIAAGCPVVVKPASATPMSCESLVKMIYEAGLPKKWCQMILTENDLTTKLVADKRVAFLTFIGSSNVGWMLRSKLAPGANCALEHGGVAPAILDETANLDDAIPLLTKGGFYHAGQVCVSVQRIYVHASIQEELTARLVKAAKALEVGDPTRMETEVGPLIWPKEVERVHEWVTEAKEKGAKVLCGGEPLGKTTYPPTLLLNPPDDVKVSTEEVFGPVVCVYSYDDIDDAVKRANLERAYFQAALFTNRLDRALEIGRQLHGMSVMINDHTAFRVDWMPFGGHRDSGLNLGGIEHSMRDMTIERMIVFRR